MKCYIEVFIESKWIVAADFEVRPRSEVVKGYRGSGFLNYDLEYTERFYDHTAISAVSCRYKVNYELYQDDAWPPFLLDLLPSGASRRYWIDELGIGDGPEADWPLLLNASGNPPGNIRIREAAQKISEATGARKIPHEGFDYSDVLARRETFIEYANSHGAPVAGSTGAQGDAPKFLLIEDKRGRWHADGALPDDLTGKHWLVKFPRGKAESDRAILRNEAAYARVAEECGISVFELPRFEEDVLFIPRFDRKVSDVGVDRFGQESLCSLAGVAEFGKSVPQEVLCAALAQFSSNRIKDVTEFVLRDVLNVIMGNVDNHARNSAVSKYADNSVRLSPLYDFAPMFLDDQGIARVCKWTGAETSGYPDWKVVASLIDGLGIDGEYLIKELRRFGKITRDLEKIMDKCGVDRYITERVQRRIGDVSARLLQL